jgi:hypothetical protein
MSMLIFGFKSSQDFTPFLLLPDDQGICLGKIFQIGIFARGVFAVILCLIQKFADDDTAPRALIE